MITKQRHVGSAIYQYMKEKGLKQTVIARKAGIRISPFNCMLHDKQNIRAEEYFAICQALEVSLDTFERGKDGGAA